MEDPTATTTEDDLVPVQVVIPNLSAKVFNGINRLAKLNDRSRAAQIRVLLAKAVEDLEAEEAKSTEGLRVYR